ALGKALQQRHVAAIAAAGATSSAAAANAGGAAAASVGSAAGAAAEGEAEADRRELLVTLEFLAAIDTPAEDKARRMDLQVARLSQRMSGGQRGSAREELTALLQRWIALGPLPAATAASWQARFRRAFDAALAQLD
ncbi:hypothetical protein, partial [Tahibacter caeni]|uniref:hypothetical protein n=1 Tax=Tahibacter caeni TaxID=1453545 RepID=UPI002148E68E